MTAAVTAAVPSLVDGAAVAVNPVPVRRPRGTVVEERAALRALLAGPRWRDAFLLAPPAAVAAVDAYRAGDDSPEVESTVLDCVQQLTHGDGALAVGFARWSVGAPDLTTVPTTTGHVDVSPHPAFVAAAGSPGGVRVNGTLQVVGDELRFQHRDGDRVRLLSVPVTGRLRTLMGVAALGTAAERDLVDRLAPRLPGGRTEAERLVADARRSQLLTPAPTGPLDAGTRAALDALRAAIGADREPALARLRAGAARWPIVENRWLEPVSADPAGYRDALDDLAAVLAWQSLFDPRHETRALLTAAFTDRYRPGAAVPLVDAAADLVAMVGRRGAMLDDATVDDFGPADGSLAALRGARSAALDAIDEQLRDASGEVALDPLALAGAAAALPDRFRRVPASYGVLVRPWRGRLVVDGYRPGWGSWWARLLRPGADEELARLRVRLRGAWPSARLRDDAEPRASLGYPPVPVAGDPIGPAGWAAATLAHDPAADELRLLDGDGVPLVVAPPVLTATGPLPPALTVAAWLTGSRPGAIDPFARTAAALRAARGPAPTIRLPRLVAGGVVLAPARWYPGTDPVAGLPDEVLAARRAGPPRHVDRRSPLAATVLDRWTGGGHLAGFLAEFLSDGSDGEPLVRWFVESDRPGSAA